jgi:O-antigen/teichoic acid export membrane protein
MLDTSQQIDMFESSQSPSSDQNILTAAKGGGITFIGTMLEYAGRFVLGFLLARLLGDEQYGLYSLADSAFYLTVGISLLGLNTGTTHFVSVYAAQRDQESLWKTIQVGLGLPFAISLLGGILFHVLANPLAGTVFREPRLAPLLRIVALAVPAGALASAAGFVLLGFKQVRYNVIAQSILQTVVKLVLVVLLAITGLNAVKAMTAYSLAMIAACILLMYFVNKLFPLRRPPSVSRHHIRQMLSFSLPVYFAELLTMLGPNLRTLLLGALNTVSSAGIFTAASRVSMVSTAFSNSMAMMSMPIVSELYADGKRQGLGHFYQTMTKWIFTFNLPFFLLLLFFPRPILSIFGESYATGSTGLVILAYKNLAGAAVGICGVMVVMTGNTWLNTLNAVIQLTLIVALSALLIPGLGMVGAAIATTVGLTIIDFILVVEVFLLFRILPYNKSFLKPVVAGLLSFVITYAVDHWVFRGDSAVGTVISVGALLTTYVSTILLLGLSEEDRAVLGHLQRHLSRLPIVAKLIQRLPLQ